MPDKKPAAAPATTTKKAKPVAGKPPAEAKKNGKSTVGPDPFFGSELVSGLNSNNFESFMSDTSVVLVMFYDTSAGTYETSKAEFVQAAENTTRANHAYAGVDCKHEADLCKKELVTKFPFFQLYSQGHYVNGEPEDKSFNHHNMKNFVENSPDFDLYPPEQKVCMSTKRR